MSTPTILVTGGTGFLGRALGRLLRERARVVLAGRNNEQNRTAALATGCEVLPMDVTNVASVRDAVVEVKPKAIIHAAASKFVDLAEKHPGARVLDGRFTVVQQAAGVPKARGLATKYLLEFIEDIKTSGLVAKIIESNGVRGVSVAPRNSGTEERLPVRQ